MVLRREDSGRRYVLGSHTRELARLDHQAAAIERQTRLLLQMAGIERGMRVLDLGTGLGHVARLAGELVGPAGAVLGIDQSLDALAVARDRTRAAGVTHVTFTEGTVDDWLAPEPFDAIVGRLLLFHAPDPGAVVRHQLRNLRRGGLFVAIDFDIGSARTEPAIAVAEDALRWVMEAFRAAGAWPRIGATLGMILEGEQLTGVTTLGLQAYIPPRDPTGAALLAGVVRSLAPTIIDRGIASSAQLELETLEPRIADALAQAHAVLLPPTVVGAWGRSGDLSSPSVADGDPRRTPRSSSG